MNNLNKKRQAGKVAFDNSGRVLLVTGGGQGIGREVAYQWHLSGGTAIVMEFNRALEEKISGWGRFLQGDVTSVEDCQRVVATVLEEFGGIDLLVPNAVIEGPESYRRPHEIGQELWQRYFEVNTTGFQNIGRAAIPAMLEQEAVANIRGYIVMISSVQAIRAAGMSSLYGATKAATFSLAQSWAIAYARDRIVVNAVLPGAVMTEGMVPKLQGQGGPEALANRHARGCLATPEEIARVVLALASPIADNVQGSAWASDGGLLATSTADNPFDLQSLPEQPIARWQTE